MMPYALLQALPISPREKNPDPGRISEPGKYNAIQ